MTETTLVTALSAMLLAIYHTVFALKIHVLKKPTHATFLLCIFLVNQIGYTGNDMWRS